MPSPSSSVHYSLEGMADRHGKKTFRQLKLKQSCLDGLERTIQRQQGLVRHIWLNIELRPYTCRCCRECESLTWTHMNNKIILDAISKLFSVLSTWKPTREGLTLEQNAYSPSDSQHWCKNWYFGAPDKDNILDPERPLQNDATEIDDPNHGWRNGMQIDPPNNDAIRRPHATVSIKIPKETPKVEAVTAFLLRRQCRRQWDPSTLSCLWKKLPQLESIMYEPWQLYDKDIQYLLWEPGYLELINTPT
ncbi:hypothetical protein EDB81DRAFT_895922 [Dactylonectria macrodidyma]|uniref:Uncharacterized protein n=1 Tax=Dactylonectria macrodidyma TaxID=307937 RepID=A0A9P9JM84_9HYPO|nr:hypothetical protein EDB81DRAFT_895922 [Dactylonectria macrodidyma]